MLQQSLCRSAAIVLITSSDRDVGFLSHSRRATTGRLLMTYYTQFNKCFQLAWHWFYRIFRSGNLRFRVPRLFLAIFRRALLRVTLPVRQLLSVPQLLLAHTEIRWAPTQTGTTNQLWRSSPSFHSPGISRITANVFVWPRWNKAAFCRFIGTSALSRERSKRRAVG
jgi:hypothetical protein